MAKDISDMPNYLGINEDNWRELADDVLDHPTAKWPEGAIYLLLSFAIFELNRRDTEHAGT